MKTENCLQVLRAIFMHMLIGGSHCNKLWVWKMIQKSTELRVKSCSQIYWNFFDCMDRKICYSSNFCFERILFMHIMRLHENKLFAQLFWHRWMLGTTCLLWKDIYPRAIICIRVKFKKFKSYHDWMCVSNNGIEI